MLLWKQRQYIECLEQEFGLKRLLSGIETAGARTVTPAETSFQPLVCSNTLDQPLANLAALSPERAHLLVSWGRAASWWVLSPEAGLYSRVNHGQRPEATGPGLLSPAIFMVLNRLLPACVSQIWGFLTQAPAIGLPDPRDLRVGVGMCFAASE